MDAPLAQLVPLALVAFRLSGLFVFAPVLAGVAIPMRVKVLLCAVLAIAMFGLVRPAPSAIPADFFSFAVLAVGEVVFGLILGLLALLPVIAAQIAGIVMGQQMGMSLATLYNPSLDVESDVTAEVLLQLAIVAFMVMGGLEVLFLTVARSYTAVPIGAFSAHQAPLAVMNGLVTSGCELALRVSSPLLGIIFVETIAGAILMKTIPQINIISLGYGLKVMLGLLALILAYRAIGDAIIDQLGRAGQVIMHWAQNPALAGGVL